MTTLSQLIRDAQAGSGIYVTGERDSPYFHISFGVLADDTFVLWSWYPDGTGYREVHAIDHYVEQGDDEHGRGFVYLAGPADLVANDPTRLTRQAAMQSLQAAVEAELLHPPAAPLYDDDVLAVYMDGYDIVAEDIE